MKKEINTQITIQAPVQVIWNIRILPIKYIFNSLTVTASFA
jgi:hypothetical protein